MIALDTLADATSCFLPQLSGLVWLASGEGGEDARVRSHYRDDAWRLSVVLSRAVVSRSQCSSALEMVLTGKPVPDRPSKEWVTSANGDRLQKKAFAEMSDIWAQLEPRLAPMLAV